MSVARSWIPSTFLLTLLATAASLLLPSTAPAQTVGYALEPGATWVTWDDDLGIEDAWMWGGAVTLELGSRIRLSPFYLTQSGIDADPAELGDGESPFPGAEPVNLDVRHVGVDLDLDLASGPVVPFLRVGGGVLRLDPENREALERIALTYGGGVRFGLGRAGIRLFAQGTSYRLAPERLYAPDMVPEGEEGDRRNLSAGARVSIPVSEMPGDPGVGLVSASAPVGVFAGEMDFAGETGLDDQRLAGVRAGIAFNPLVSLQGFYWTGVNDDFDATEDIRGYGAEARFDLGTGTGVSPFLLAGGGRIDFDDDPEGEDVEPREDRTALILGGGLAFRLTDRVELQASARDYLLDTTGDLEDATDPGDLTSNWLYSAGLSVRLGGTTAQTRAERRAEATAEERERLREELERLRAQQADTAREMAPDTTAARVDTVEVAERPDTLSRQIRTPEGRIITLPVLEEGAIYIRFGPEGADTRRAPEAGMIMDRTTIRRIIREELQRVVGDTVEVEPGEMEALEERLLERLRGRVPQPDPGVRAEARDTVVSQQILERLDALERRLDRRIDELARERRQAEPARRPVVVEEERPEPGVSAWDRAGRLDVQTTTPYVGLHTGDETQAVVGVRLDFGPFSPGSALRFVPEAAFGFGDDDPTLSVMGNVQFPVGTLGGERNLQPYLLGGVGFFSPTFLGLTTGLGVELDLRPDDPAPLRSFVELQGINLFDRTRILVGVSLPR